MYATASSSQEVISVVNTKHSTPHAGTSVSTEGRHPRHGEIIVEVSSYKSDLRL